MYLDLLSKFVMNLYLTSLNFFYLDKWILPKIGIGGLIPCAAAALENALINLNIIIIYIPIVIWLILSCSCQVSKYIFQCDVNMTTLLRQHETIICFFSGLTDKHR